MRKILTILLSVFLLNTFVFSDFSIEEKSQSKYYDNAKVLRVKHTSGEVFIQRSYDEGLEEATVNLPIFEKDMVGTTEGRVEVYLGRLNYLRLDYDTEVEFDRIPELRKTNIILKVKKGGIYLDIENLDYERDIEVQTQDCGIFLLDKGVYRINVSERGQTEVYIYEGIAEVSGNDYSRNVRENQKIVMSNGEVIERPFYFYTTDTDGFDQWNRERNNAVGYARYSTSRYLERGYEDYEYELSRNGRWTYSSSGGEYAWIPYNIGSSWSPYYHGRWIWTPFYGYVWSSYDPWGYFTHHYGRWHWDTYFGWHWFPGSRWSPAWVSWFWDDYHFGWCPLSRWNRPIIIINKRWMRNYNHRRGIPLHSRSAVIVKKNQLRASQIHKVALKKSDINKIGKETIMFKGAAPKIKPSINKLNVINARGKPVLYKKSGFLKTKSYKFVESAPGVSKETSKKTVYKYSGSKSLKKKVFKYSSPVKSSTSKRYMGIKEKKYSSSAVSKSKSSPKSKSSSSKSSSSRKSSGSQKIKKKKNEPSYSYKSSGSSSSYESKSKYSSNYKSTYKYKPSSYNSYSKKKSYSYSSNKSYKKPTYKSSSPYKKSYSRPKSSSRSSRSYSKSSSRSSSRSSRSSSSRSSSSRSSSSKSSSSKSSVKKK